MAYRPENPNRPGAKRQRLQNVLLDLVEPGTLIPTQAWDRLMLEVVDVGTERSAANYTNAMLTQRMIEKKKAGTSANSRTEGYVILPA